MANAGVDGTLTVIGVGGISAAGFTVEIHERGLFGKRLLGTADTDASGKYSVRYFPSPFDRRLVIELYDKVHRLIDTWRISGVNTPVVVHDITKFQGVLGGWLHMGGMLSAGNQVTLLIDNAAAWGQLTAEVSAASETIHIAQLQFELDYMFTQFVPDPPAIGTPTTGERLELELKMAASRGAEVKLLMNDFAGVGYPADMWDEVQQYFEDTDVEIKGFERALHRGDGAMHAKIAIFDGNTAYTIGSGLIQEYFDGDKHLIDDPRRGEMTWPGNQMKVPIHDVSARIVGNTARDMEWVFTALWTCDSSHAFGPARPAAGPHSVQLAITLPGRTVDGADEGVTSILDAYQRAIGLADDFIYIENQYLTDDNIIESLNRALTLKPNLQAILLLNPHVDVPFYGPDWWHPLKGWQDEALARLLDPAHVSRVGLFSLWGQETTSAGSRVIRNYVHSKVAIVDDKWATVGSANLDGLSLSTNQLAAPFETLFRDESIALKRAIEVNAIFYNGVAGQPASNLPDLMRRTLWAEHLGYSNPNHPDLVTRPAGGWIKLWEAVAARRAAALNARPPTADAARILRGPFYVPNTPELESGIYRVPGAMRFTSPDGAFLFRCGVEPAGHTVEDEVRSFDFNTGKWF